MNPRLEKLMRDSGYAAPEIAGRAHVLARLIVQDCAEQCLDLTVGQVGTTASAYNRGLALAHKTLLESYGYAENAKD